MRKYAAVICALGAGAIAAAAQPVSREIENVVAFARLYGVVRYFCPSDAAALIDWNAFAVHGIRRTRTAQDSNSLRAVLVDLFAPFDRAIQIGSSLSPAPPTGAPDRTLVAWRYVGFRGERTNRPPIRGVALYTQSIPGEALRGKAIRLRGEARAQRADAAAETDLILYVQRGAEETNYVWLDHVIRDSNWREYSVQTDLDDKTTVIQAGVRLLGAVTADFRGLSLEVRELPGAWRPLPLDQPWRRGGTQEPLNIAWLADATAPERQILRVGPSPDSPLSDWTVPQTNDTVEVDLGSGLKARVRLALSESAARQNESGVAARASLEAALETAPSSERPDIDARLADVVVAWNTYRHFYPYWSETGVDWDRRLRPHLESVYAAGTREQEWQVLRRLVAEVRDGHGLVSDTLRPQSATLPVRFGVAEQQVFITASAMPERVPVGAIVTAIDGVPAAQRLGNEVALFSGSEQWRIRRATRFMTICSPGTLMRIAFTTDTGSRQGIIPCDPAAVPLEWLCNNPKCQPYERRPDRWTEVAPGLWYVDLGRVTTAEFTSHVDELARAKGVIFDMRAYPDDVGRRVLLHLLDAPETGRWMHLARVTGPFQRLAGWDDFGWDLKPVSPRISAKVVFLTDSRTISYAESLMGYVADRKLGTIVGSTTAATNGNVASFSLPGGFNVQFTALRVTHHDGRTPYHLIGTLPDVLVEPTLDGLRAGRDEVLERAIAVIHSTIDPPR